MSSRSERPATTTSLPSVLLHGVGNAGAMWRDLMAVLPAYHCLAPDLPGHGASRPIPWRSRADTAQRVAALIEERAINGRAHVVGLSLGGSVAIELLATRPDLLERVVVDGCGALPSPVIGPMAVGVAAISPFLRFGIVARFIGRAVGVQPGPGLDDFVAQIQAADTRSFRRAFADANATRATPALLTATCPTLFVAGERELRHVRASNRLFAERMPQAEARMVPGASWLGRGDPARPASAHGDGLARGATAALRAGRGDDRGWPADAPS